MTRESLTTNPKDAYDSPSSRTLALEHKKLKDRARNLRNLLVKSGVDDTCEHYDIVREACLESLKVVSDRLEDEALILLGDLDNCKQEQGVEYAVASYVTPSHVLWAQKRAHVYLDAVQKIFENAAAMALQLEMSGVYSLITRRNSDRDLNEFMSPLLMVSPWCLPKLVIDVRVGGPVSYAYSRNSEDSTLCSTSIADNSRRRKRVNSGLSDAILCKADSSMHIQLPISIEVRAISEIYLTGEGASSTLHTSSLTNFEVEIVKVVHEKCTQNLAYGDVSILLILRSLLDEDRNTHYNDDEICAHVTQARM